MRETEGAGRGGGGGGGVCVCVCVCVCGVCVFWVGTHRTTPTSSLSIYICSRFRHYYCVLRRQHSPRTRRKESERNPGARARVLEGAQKFNSSERRRRRRWQSRGGTTWTNPFCVCARVCVLSLESPYARSRAALRAACATLKVKLASSAFSLAAPSASPRRERTDEARRPRDDGQPSPTSDAHK